MTQPKDATHKDTITGLYYKQKDGQAYVHTSDGRWIKSIGGDLDKSWAVRSLKELGLANE